jgi:hypothetical protein
MYVVGNKRVINDLALNCVPVTPIVFPGPIFWWCVFWCNLLRCNPLVCGKNIPPTTLVMRGMEVSPWPWAW